MNCPHTSLFPFFPLQLKYSDSLDVAIGFDSIAETPSFEVVNK